VGGLRRSALIACALAAALAPPAAAQTRSLAVGQAVPRTCQAGLAPAGAPGTARAAFEPHALGVATLRLAGAGGDWDLALFDAATGRALNAGATYGPSELATATVWPGQALIAQACRRTGRGGTAKLSFDLYEEKPVATEPAALVRVPLDGVHTRERLEATGLDVTHDIGPDHASVVVYSAAERARLAAAGFPPTTVIGDMRADDLTRAHTDARYAKLTAASALPSGRDNYRTLADYGTDLKSIVDKYPAIARRVEIGKSLEGRPIEGVELAGDVRGHDGRPVFAVMGGHHAREWPATEMPIEFALDLAAGYGKNARITDLLDRVRVIALPIINPDGFNVSRGAGPTPFDDDPNATLPLSVADGASYKRKNCRAQPGFEDVPCSARPAAQGVDPNRNYGAYWGGVGSSTDPTSQGYRGPAPYSEPEPEAVHKLSSTRSIVTIITHHTFTEPGVWLRQPGFCSFKPPCHDPNDPSTGPLDDVVPDEAQQKSLGDAMGKATGWRSALGWDIGEITGATEDWNYFTQGADGYTPEQRGPNFHPSYQTAVVAEYTGTAAGAHGGVREALLVAGERSANPSFHSLLLGSAPPGRVLRLRKSFTTDTSQPAVKVQDKLDFTTIVPDSGFYSWHVNKSTRPLSTGPEAYTLTCEAADGQVIETHSLVIERGQTITEDLACGGTGTPSPDPVISPPAPGACADVRRPLSSPARGSFALSATGVSLRGRARDYGCKARTGLAERRGSLARVLVAVARVSGGHCRFLTAKGKLGKTRSCARPQYLPATGLASWKFQLAAQGLAAGAYQAWTRSVDSSGNVENRRRRILTAALR
jgi:zinc carboxypeptidase